MKRIVTHVLVAAGLAAGACGVAQAHTNLSIGLSLGAPAPTYVSPAPQPVYYGNRYWGDRRYEGYRRDYGWNHGWNRDRRDHGNRWNDNNGNRWSGNNRGWHD
jgi:hypothetical protein